jgi:hypothetical protein
VLDTNKSDHIFKKVNNIFSVIDLVCNTVTRRGFDEIEYKIHFLSCSSQLSVAQRKSIMRKHSCISKKRKAADTKKDNYVRMEHHRKRLRLQHMAIYNTMRSPERKETYKAMDVNKKKELLNMFKERYQTMDMEKKKKLLLDYAEKYDILDPEQKKTLGQKNVQNYQNMEQPLKLEYLNTLRNNYNDMDLQTKNIINTKKREAVHQARSVEISLQND